MLIKWECNVNEMRLQCKWNETVMLMKWEYNVDQMRMQC